LKPRRALIRFTSGCLIWAYRLLGGFRVRGLENIPGSGAALIVPNHLSWADPPAVRAVIRRTCWFMANDFLFRIPILGRLLPLYGAFPVSRGRIDRTALRTAEDHLKRGDLVVVFPEGGTSLTGRLVPFELGPAMLALRAGVPMIPVAITGTDRVLPMRRPFPHFARGGVTITFGAPIPSDSIDPALPHRARLVELTRRAQDAVAAMLPQEYLPVDR
jgi:1-acyl-sn-glycerol-3-phosphate acyltransferase